MRYALAILLKISLPVTIGHAQDAFIPVDLVHPDRSKLEWLTYESVMSKEEKKPRILNEIWRFTTVER